MKTKIVALVIGIALAGFLTVGVVVQYQRYKQDKARSESATQQKQDKVAAEYKASITKLEERNKVLLIECQKGVVAYGQLQATTRAKLPAPNCIQ